MAQKYNKKSKLPKVLLQKDRMNVLSDIFCRLLYAEQRGIDAEMIALGMPPALARIVVVVGGTFRFAFLNDAAGLVTGTLVTLADVVDAEVHRSGDKEVHRRRVVTQHIVGTAAYKDAALVLFCSPSDGIALELEESLL